ncbi:MAG: CvpA family protein [Flavobacteriales bacterium]|nr:CvpA family protein [Flavobacteriales bacterium]
MAVVDIIILVPLVWFTIKGFRKGLVIEVAGLAGLVLGVYGAIRFSPLVGNYLNDKLSLDPQWITILSFVLAFVIILLAVRLIAKTVEKMLDLTALSGLNKILGASFGLLKIGVIVGLLIYVFDIANQRFPMMSQDQKQDTKVYKFFSDNLPKYVPVVERLLNSDSLNFDLQKPYNDSLDVEI